MQRFLVTLIGLNPALAQTVNWGDLTQRVQSQSVQVELAQAQKSEAEASLQTARSMALPSLNLSGTAAQTDDALQSFGMKVMQRQASFADFGAGEFNPMAGASGLNVQPQALNFPKEQRDFGLSLSLQAPLFTGGKLSAARAGAQAAIQAGNHNLQWQKTQALFELYQAKAKWDGASAYVRVADEAIQTFGEMVRLIERFKAEGLSQKSDLLSAELKLREAQLQKLQALDEVKAAENQMRTLAHLEAGATLQLEASPLNTLDSAYSCGPLLNQGLEALGAWVRIKTHQVEMQKADYWPAVGMEAKLESHNPDYPSPEAWSYTLGLKAQWQIFAWGQTESQVQKAEAENRQMQMQYRKAQEQMQLNCQNLSQALQTNLSKIKVRKESLSAAEENLRLNTKRYQEGLSPLVEWMAAETLWEKSKADLVAVQIESQVQALALKMLQGQNF